MTIAADSRAVTNNRRPEAPRKPGPSLTNVTEEEIILPGESLAKHRGKPAVAPATAPFVEHETRDAEQTAVEEITPRATGNPPTTSPSGSGVPRRFSGGCPAGSWPMPVLKSKEHPRENLRARREEASADGSAAVEPSRATAGNDAEAVRNDLELNEDQVAALASGFVEAKHEETQEEAEADAIVGGAEFDEEEAEEQAEVGTEEAEETQSAEVSELSEEEAEEVEAGRAANGRNSLRMWPRTRRTRRNSWRARTRRA